MNRSPRRAAALCALLTSLTVCSVPWCVDGPLGAQRRAPTHAALAIRDDVSAFEELGTALFTRPALERSYGEVAYLTLGDGRASWRDAQDELTRLGTYYDRVDLFLLTHGNDVSWLFGATHTAESGKLGLVYHTGCGNAAEADRWLSLGARTFISHRGLSLSPVFYVPFLRRWLRGGEVGAAHQEAQRIAAAVIAALRGDVSASGSEAILRGDAGLRLEGAR